MIKELRINPSAQLFVNVRIIMLIPAKKGLSVQLLCRLSIGYYFSSVFNLKNSLHNCGGIARPEHEPALAQDYYGES